jgi:hypothetical protein
MFEIPNSKHQIPNLFGSNPMNVEYYTQFRADLSAEFDLFALENPEWMEANVPPGAIVVLQTDEPGFNAWARQVAECNRDLEDPPRPVVLVHIRELRPPLSRIVRADAELVPAYVPYNSRRWESGQTS